MRILRLFIRTAETYETFFNLKLLRSVVLKLRFIGEVLGDGVGAEIDTAGKYFTLLEKQQIAGLGADVQQHRAIFQIAVIISECVAEGGRRDIGQLQTQPAGLRHPEQPLDNVRLESDQQHLELPAGRRAQNLIVPDDLFQRERHVLLRFVLDDLGDLAGIDRRQLDELGEDVKAGGANVDTLGLDRLFGQQPL